MHPSVETTAIRAAPVSDIEKSESDKPKKVKTQAELEERQQRLLKRYKTEENYIIKYIHRSVINQLTLMFLVYSVNKNFRDTIKALQNND